MPNFRSPVQLNGIPPLGLVSAYAAKTGAYTLTATDGMITCNASAAAFTVTLPTAAGAAGRSYTVKKTDSSANAVTIATASSQTIDGAATYTLARQYQYAAVVSDGANWQVTDGVLLLDTAAGDIQGLGTGAAGSSGLAADARHVHPAAVTGNLSVAGSGLTLPNGLTALIGPVASSTTLTTVAGLTVPAGEPAAGSVYQLHAFGVYGTAASSTVLTATLAWGAVTFGTNAFTMPASVSGSSPGRWRLDATVSFISAAQCYAQVRFEAAPGNTAGTAVAVYLFGSTGVLSPVTSSAGTLAATLQWTTASASNTFSVFGGNAWKAA